VLLGVYEGVGKDNADVCVLGNSASAGAFDRR